MSVTKELLIVFIKQPEAGKVKSRLARSIGDKKALSVYKKLIAKTLETISSLKMDKRISYSERVLDNDLFDKNIFQKTVQSGQDLGERMHHAIATASSEGYDKICLIGSDIYDLTGKIIVQAFNELDHCDIVLGPATDGGYYLVGVKNPVRNIFRGIKWGTAHVLEQTIEKIEQEQLTFTKLPKLNDIDTIEDIRDSDRGYLLS